MMLYMPMKTFVNLPVRDLNKTMGFFTRLGFEFNPQFTDENAACMIVSDDAYVMFLVDKFFKTFTKKSVANSKETAEVIIALSVDTREKVDELVTTAFDAGGKKYKDVEDKGFMYGWGFEDIDGHVWEIIFMDPEHISKPSEETTEEKSEHKKRAKHTKHRAK